MINMAMLARRYGGMAAAQAAVDAWLDAGYTEAETYRNCLEMKKPPPVVRKVQRTRPDKKDD